MNQFLIENGVLVRCKLTDPILRIPEGVTKIDGYFLGEPYTEEQHKNAAFVEEIYIPEGVTAFPAMGVPMRKLRTIHYPSTLREIGKLSFAESLEAMDLRHTAVTELPLSMFFNCTSLKEVLLPEGLKRIGSAAFAHCTQLKELTIPESVTSLVGSEVIGTFEQSGLTAIVLPQSLTSIENGTFRRCGQLTSVQLPSKLQFIGAEAFRGCGRLTQLDIPASVTRVGRDAFRNCGFTTRLQFPGIPETRNFYSQIGIAGDENGCLVEDGVLKAYYGPLHRIVVTEGVHTIEESVFPFADQSQCLLPDSVKRIEKQPDIALDYSLPAGYLQTRDALPGEYTLHLLQTCWADKATIQDYACLYLFQTTKGLLNHSAEALGKDPAGAAAHMVALAQEKCKPSQLAKAAEFVRGYAEQIPQETIQALHAAAKKNKKALELLTPLLNREEIPEEPDYIKALRTKFNEFDLDRLWKEHKCAKLLDISTVLLADGVTPAPEFAVKCAVAPCLSGNIDPEADQAAQLLDRKSLVDMLRKSWTQKRTCNMPLYPYCRYAPAEEIPDLIKQIKQLRKWEEYGDEGMKRANQIESALLLSDAQDALLYCAKMGNLKPYADRRGLDEEVLQDTVMMDFGLDAQGRKTYDLGTKTVTATLTRNLTLDLYDNGAKKVIKSIPKKGTDPNLAAAAAADLTAMKKNMKNVVKQRNARLWEEFLHEKPRPAASWTASYTANPLLKLVAQLIVWKQGKATFLLDEAGKPISSDGAAYEITDEPISVAHPLEMEAADVVRWQEYFRSHGLKQPFEQIWEPAYDLSAIAQDRYQDCQISIFRFMNADKHGITFEDEDFHAYIGFTLEDCILCHDRTTPYRHELGKDETFSLGAFLVQKPTRTANHIVYLLDKWTIQSRIQKDDPTAAQMAETMTAAQVIELLNLAIESNAPSCTAALLNLKNNKFPDYTQEMEFLL